MPIISVFNLPSSKFAPLDPIFRKILDEGCRYEADILAKGGALTPFWTESTQLKKADREKAIQDLNLPDDEKETFQGVGLSIDIPDIDRVSVFNEDGPMRDSIFAGAKIGFTHVNMSFTAWEIGVTYVHCPCEMAARMFALKQLADSQEEVVTCAHLRDHVFLAGVATLDAVHEWYHDNAEALDNAANWFQG